jgi:hypothetical protein
MSILYTGSNYSASKLCKMSALQIWREQNEKKKKVEIPRSNNQMFLDNFKNFIDDQQQKGQDFAEKSSRSKYVEMVSRIPVTNIGILWYSVDEILVSDDWTENYLVEHKCSTDYKSKKKTPFLFSAICQSALYYSLYYVGRHRYGLVTFNTAKFKTGAVVPGNTLFVGHTVSQWLHIDDYWIRVNVPNPTAVVKFYLTKLRAAQEIDKARRFDKVWWDKEWSYLRSHINLDLWDNEKKWSVNVNAYDLFALMKHRMNKREASDD